MDSALSPQVSHGRAPFSGIEQTLPWTQGPAASTSGGQQRRGNLGDDDGLLQDVLLRALL